MLIKKDCHNFWKRVKEEMFIQGLQVKDLIKDSETMESTIKKSIQRDSIPDLHLAIQIAKSLNVSVEYLAMGIESSISSSS